MKYYVLPYCLKVWATTVLLAPIPLLLYFFIDHLFNQKDSGTFLPAIGLLFQVYLAFIAAGAVLSFITFIVFWVISIAIYCYTTNMMHRKLIMSLIGAMLTALTFILLYFLLSDGLPDISIFMIMSIYCFCMAGCSLFYRFD